MEIERRVRCYQQPLHRYLVNGGKRAIEIAHRRWGKDEIALLATSELAHQRVGNYWHCLPEYEQARKALWTSVNAHTGKRRIDEAFPPEIVASRDEHAMFLRLRNGSTWQLIGSDRYDATVGSGPVGLVYSEWALANPSAWAYHRPMLVENGGWSLFITTPRGNNHAKAMFQQWSAWQKEGRDYFAEISSVRETGALTEEQLAEALAEAQALYGTDVGRAQFEQEYLCSFNAALLGAYFGSEMSDVERSGRLLPVPINEAYPVHTAWDLGKAVNNPIWCFQVIGSELRIVDFYRPESDDLEEWCKWLDDRGYHGNDYVPHDILTTDWGNRRNRIDTLKLLKRKPKRVGKVSVADRQAAARRSIKVAQFHSGDDERGERMELGIDGLKNYRREWDDELKTFRENPVKDWAEHIGSAFCYLGLAWQEERTAPPPKPKPMHEFEASPGQHLIKSNMTIPQLLERQRRRRENA